MSMAIGIMLIWVGCLLVYVGVHGVESGNVGFQSIWEQAIRDITGDTGG